MEIFSKKWIKYKLLLLSKEYHLISDQRKNGVDFSKFDLFENFNQKYIFIHIPKAAGMSIVKSLTGNDFSHHASAIEYKKQNKNIFNNSFKFSIVRDPLSRCFSAYNYLQNGGRLNIYDCFWREKYIKDYKTFDHFVQDGGLERAIKYNAEHFIPQWSFLSEDDKCIVDLVGKLENIDEFIKNISHKLERKLILNKVNITKYQDNKKIEDDSILRIYDIYSKDFENLNYSRNLAQPFINN